MSSAEGITALTYREALQAIVGASQPLGDELVRMEDARGRALAGAVTSEIDLPPWDNAGMDGYAVRADDVRGASSHHPVALPVTATVAAGADVSAIEVRRGECVRIMTGAPVPYGADSVVRIEDTDGGGGIVIIGSDRDLAGRGNVRPKGEDVRAGEVLFGPGTTINAAHTGVLASIGMSEVRVHRRPRVTIVSSGDELVLLDEFETVKAGRRIVSSTSYALPQLLTMAGADVTVMPIARDTPADVINALSRALSIGCDLLITTGGVSVGAHDYTRDALRALGGTLDFWRAKIRPGGPIGTGSVSNVRWLGLPGNPVSSMVTAFLFAWPSIRRMAGHARVYHRPLQVRLKDAAETPGALTHFLRIVLDRDSNGELGARLAGPQGSNLMRILAHADGLLVVPEDRASVHPGELLDALIFPEDALVTDVA